MFDLPNLSADKVSSGEHVAALWPDGVFYPGIVRSVFNRDNVGGTRFSVEFEDGYRKEFTRGEIVSRNPQNMKNVHLKFNQRVFVSHNGVETAGFVQKHRKQTNEIFIKLEDKEETLVRRKLHEVSLISSLKISESQSNDAHLFLPSKDVAETKKRTVTPDAGTRVPSAKTLRYTKEEEPAMSEVMAAMILTSLHTAQPMEYSTAPCSPLSISPEPSTSPHSPSASSGHFSWDFLSRGTPSPGLSLSDAESSSSGQMAFSYLPQGTPAESMPGALVFSSSVDEGIDMGSGDSPSSVYWDDHNRSPKKIKIHSPSRILYRCTWQRCTKTLCTVQGIERHIRTVHLGKKENDFSDHEEEFYYTEIESTMETFSNSFASMMTSSPPPFDRNGNLSSPNTTQVFFPVNQVNLQCNMNQTISHSPNSTSLYRTIPSPAHVHNKVFETEVPHGFHVEERPRHLHSSPSKAQLQIAGLSCSTKIRAEGRKCRKVYGMGNRNLWCTQCKWKKACTRFV